MPRYACFSCSTTPPLLRLLPSRHPPKVALFPVATTWLQVEAAVLSLWKRLWSSFINITCRCFVRTDQRFGRFGRWTLQVGHDPCSTVSHLNRTRHGVVQLPELPNMEENGPDMQLVLDKNIKLSPSVPILAKTVSTGPFEHGLHDAVHVQKNFS